MWVPSTVHTFVLDPKKLTRLNQTYNTIAICPFVCFFNRNPDNRGERQKIEQRFFLLRGDRGRGSVRFYVLLFAQIIIIFVLGVIWLNHAKSSSKKQCSSEDFT